MYLTFFPPPILAQKSRDLLYQGNVEISCLSRYGPETSATRNHVTFLKVFDLLMPHSINEKGFVIIILNIILPL
jgi:hypothetical protein